jgi:membrane protease YdiL (CAAX protease family)
MHKIFDELSKRILFWQIILVVINTLVFLILIFFLQGLLSFIVPFSIYWLILLLSIIRLQKDKKIIPSYQELLQNNQNTVAIIIGYVPAILVLIVTIIPLKNEVNIRLLIIAIVIGLINGFIEEVFWRGTVYQNNNKFTLILSNILFAINHCGFLFLNIMYQGGAVNLLGGPLIMGFIWLYATKKNNSLTHVIISHQIVNTFAFYSTFCNNGF